jgi:hypothetical protein
VAQHCDLGDVVSGWRFRRDAARKFLPHRAQGEPGRAFLILVSVLDSSDRAAGKQRLDSAWEPCGSRPPEQYDLTQDCPFERMHRVL